MQQVLLHHFPEERAEYKFYNRRAGDLFTRESFDWFQDRVRGASVAVLLGARPRAGDARDDELTPPHTTRTRLTDTLPAALADVRLTATERAWLEMTCPYFKAGYLDFLEELELRPDEQVEASFVPDPAAASGDGRELGAVEIVVRGKWVETILYEVRPLLHHVRRPAWTRADHRDRSAAPGPGPADGAAVRGLLPAHGPGLDARRCQGCAPSLFSFTQSPLRTDLPRWSPLVDAAAAKCKKLLAHNIAFSEFGTRRRRSAAVHDLVVQGLIAGQADLQAAGYAGRGRLAGTSNVLLAMRYGLAPVGTIAHEHFMGVAALKGYEGVNARALDLWEEGAPRTPFSVSPTATISLKSAG